MLRDDEHGRTIIHCDRCAVKMDLGPTLVVRNRQPFRLPTGWFALGEDHHQCAMHELPRAAA